jgi:antitoxin HigA-1
MATALPLKGLVMPMKNPPHPGHGLKDDIDALGVTRQQLYNVIAGRSDITPEMALRLEKGVGSTADAWLGMQAAYDLAQLRGSEPTIKVKKLAGKVA